MTQCDVGEARGKSMTINSYGDEYYCTCLSLQMVVGQGLW